MRLAIVHDDFMQWGGAERLVAAMAVIWPEAPIYTALYDPQKLPEDFSRQRLRVSFLQRLPWAKKLYYHLFWLHPLAFESFDFSDFDVVLSSTTRFAKNLITKPKTLHICYCNTPPRFLWPINQYLERKEFNLFLRPIYKSFLPFFISFLRLQDQISAQKVDYFIANSYNVARRIKKFYRCDSEVIYPFVQLERFNDSSIPSSVGKRSYESPFRSARKEVTGYFLIVSRLGGHKRVDLAIESFNKLGLPLVIIGDGPEMSRYQRMARSNIKFLGRLSDEDIERHYHNCRAFIYPQVEDFGITALEAQAAGKPVIAFRGGGVLETVVEGKTGVFFYPQTAQALIKAVQEFDASLFSAEECKKQAQKFSKERFQREIKSFVEKKWEKSKS